MKMPEAARPLIAALSKYPPEHKHERGSCETVTFTNGAGKAGPAPAVRYATIEEKRMASPPIPPSLEQLTTRPFSFYPPILNVEHNEWLFRKATWAELLVVNCKTGSEIWISRRFIGEISRVDDPVVIVGLTKELEFKAGPFSLISAV